MKTLRRILTESIRQGLPHITTMDHKQFGNLIQSGKIHLHDVTEKTDGSTHMFGYDEHGFYSQSSGSGKEKMRQPADFEVRARRRSEETGKPYDNTASKMFGHVHSILHSNGKLQQHLAAQYQKTGKEVKVRGELFYRPLARKSEHPGEVKFVGTSYDPSHMGTVGKYVIHSKLPENQDHNIEHFKTKLSTHELNFDDDKIGVKKTSIDVSDHAKAYNALNHDLLNARTTPKNKDQKQVELAKLDDIKDSVSKKIDNHVRSLSLSPRWGTGSEGLVIHPVENQPRFKVTSDTFRTFKKSGEDFKQRKTIKEMFSLLNEGGNMKIGNHMAAPFKVTNRTQQARDIHDALNQIHDSFHSEHGEHLFGKNKKALHSGSIFAGSTKQLMDPKISDEEFSKHKPTVGDVDIQVTHAHKDALVHHLTPGKKFGKYTVLGTKKHGLESTAIMRHENGENHQFDFEGVEYKDHEPTKAEQFLHSSDWEDAKKGIKGAHHKILLNSAGMDTHKFSISHGLKSRTDETDPGEKEHEGITKKLFGPKADPSKISSFHGVAELIGKHIPPEHHQKIYDKFKDSVTKNKFSNDSALAVLKSHLKLSDSKLNEESEKTGHTSVIPLMGASPISHMGHAHDLGGALRRLPGTKHVGISSKADLFSPEERKSILNRQWKDVGHTTHVVKMAGETVRKAYDSIPENTKRKELHLLVGGDRKDFADGLKTALEAGKIKEMEGRKFDKIHVHFPEDTNRTHGMSGTKMRTSVSQDDFDTFHNHLGKDEFSKKEASSIFKKIKTGLSSGKVKVKRSVKESFQDFILTEKVLNVGLNPDHEKYREQYRDQVHSLLRKSYANIGGYSGHAPGSDEESKAIHDDISNHAIKITKRGDKISSVRIYKLQHGRKTIALGTDGSDSGKADAAMVMKDDHKMKRSWGEYSGAVRHIVKNKIGSPVVHPLLANKLLGKEVKIVNDQDYERKIGGHMTTKTILGYPKYNEK